MPERVLVAVAHGSADPRAAATIDELMTVAATRTAARGLSMRAAYLGHAAPSLPQVVSALPANARVTVLPLLLTAAYHSKTDVPRVLARLRGDFPRLEVTYGATLGPHPLLLRALERRLAEAVPDALEDPGHTGVSSPRPARATRPRTPPSAASRPAGRPGPDGSRSARPTPRPPIRRPPRP
jgi:sirohydrochlorin ferrochelatase